jgi:hypothetical protein
MEDRFLPPKTVERWSCEFFNLSDLQTPMMAIFQMEGELVKKFDQKTNLERPWAGLSRATVSLVHPQ